MKRKNNKQNLEERLFDIYNRASRPHKHISKDIYFLLDLISQYNKLLNHVTIFNMEWYEKR